MYPKFLVCKRRMLIFMLLSIVIFFQYNTGSSVLADDLTSVEKWVKERILQGKVANLNKFDLSEPLGPTILTIRGHFLREMLIDKESAIPEFGIRIIGAKITGVLDLENLDIQNELMLFKCSFPDKPGENRINVNLRSCRFRKNLILEECTFYKTNFNYLKVEGHASFFNSTFNDTTFFRGLQVGGKVLIGKSKFKKLVDFHQARIEGDFSASNSTFNLANFESIKVGGTLFLGRATFNDSVDFRFAEIGVNVQADFAKFLGFKNFANFNQIKVGQFAHFNHAFFEGSAEFQGAKINRDFFANGIKFISPISYVHFDKMKVDNDAFFKNAVFKAIVSFRHVQIDGRFELNFATFKHADFKFIKVGNDMNLDDTQFSGPIILDEAVLDGNLNANSAEFMNNYSGASFKNIHVKNSASFRNANFYGLVNFRFAEIEGDFNCEESLFKNTHDKVDFHRLKVGQATFFNNAIFRGPVDFTEVNSGGNFQANGAKFMCTSMGVKFERIEVGGMLAFQHSYFAGPVTFQHASIGADLDLRQGKFTNKRTEVSFSNLKVAGSVLLSEAELAGGVNFSLADIQANFRANKTKFRNDAFFVGTSIAQNAELDSASFLQKTVFDKAVIGGNFSAKNARFAYQYGTVNFTKINVGEDASFDGAQFASQADFRDADIKGTLNFRYTSFASNLILNDAFFKNFYFYGMDSTVSRIPRIDLSRTLINRDFSLEKVQVQQLLARHLSVKGQTTLKEVRVQEADFLLSDFQTLRMSEVRWPKTASHFELAGMTYDHIGYDKDQYENVKLASKEGIGNGRVESKFSSEDSLLIMVKKSRFSPGVHTTLETFFRNEGNKEYADKIFVAQKHRERQEYDAWISLDWWSNTILWAIAGYGRYPQLALLWSALFVTIGCYFFRDQDGMKLQRPDRHQPDQFKYNPFWYSLDLFVPVIDLKAASIWQPKSERWFVRHYMRLHSVLGWLLIPIGLAALSGLIK